MNDRAWFKVFTENRTRFEVWSEKGLVVVNTFLFSLLVVLLMGEFVFCYDLVLMVTKLSELGSFFACCGFQLFCILVFVVWFRHTLNLFLGEYDKNEN